MVPGGEVGRSDRHFVETPGKNVKKGVETEVRGLEGSTYPDILFLGGGTGGRQY